MRRPGCLRHTWAFPNFYIEGKGMPTDNSVNLAAPPADSRITIGQDEASSGAPGLWARVIVDCFMTLRDGPARDARVSLNFVIEDDGIFDLASLSLGLNPNYLRERILAALSKQGSRNLDLRMMIKNVTNFPHSKDPGLQHGASSL